MTFNEIRSLVEEKADGRSFPDAKHQAWIKAVRSDVAEDPAVSGFGGLFFLFKEATVIGGTIIGQGEYELPDDYVGDLTVFLDSTYLPKVPDELMDRIHDRDYGNGPAQWWRARGTFLDIIPKPEEAGLEIRLLYYGTPDIITTLTQEDYFMRHYPMIHVYGMAAHAIEYLGENQRRENQYQTKYEHEKMKLAYANRRHKMAHNLLRFQSWDEYEEKRQIFFPQFLSD